MMLFDRNRLDIRPLKERIHDLDLASVLPLRQVEEIPLPIRETARRIKSARKSGASVILMMGGHVVRAGVQRYLIDLIEHRLITCLSMNGSCAIHDYELALIGATTESVARYIREGQFGLWVETGKINDIVNRAHAEGLGMGEAIGKAIRDGDFPHQNVSLLAACHRLGVPATVHVGIGYDIIHEHPNFDGAAAGATSYRDFLAFAREVSGLEGGVVMNFGSAVMAPEVFLKALAMARNVAHQEGVHIRRFTTLVGDLHDLPEAIREEPSSDRREYYFRPWKTMLVRTVADGGESYYVKGKHRDTIPALWTALIEDR